MSSVEARPRSTRGIAEPVTAMCRSMRPMSSLVAGVLSSSVCWVRAGFSVRGLVAGLAMFLLTGFGFVVNDILDYRKDAAAHTQRPIALGRLSRRVAAGFALALLVVVYWLSAWVGAGGAVLAATALALLVYTPTAQRLPLVKGLYVAVLCVAPMVYGSVVAHAQYGWRLYAVIVVFVAGREALMDANEIRGDLNAGMVTIAVALGEHRARIAGMGLMALSLASGVFWAVSVGGKAAFLVALLSLLCVFQWPRLAQSRRVELSRIPMLAAALALAWG